MKNLFKRKINQQGFSLHFLLPLIVIVGIAYVGYRLLVASHAATIAAPTGLDSNGVTTSSVSLRWKSTANAAGLSYSVLRNGSVIASNIDTLTTNYLDKGLSPNQKYSYSVETVGNGATSAPSKTLNVTTAASTTAISSCETISTPGNYVLDSDLSFSGGGKGGAPGCLIFSGVNKSSLDCQNHNLILSGYGLSIIQLNSVSHFVLINCNIDSSVAGLQYSTISMNGCSFVTLANNDFGANSISNGSTSGIINNPGKDVIVNGNNFINSDYNELNVSDSYVGHNTFEWTNISVSNPQEISSDEGKKNVIVYNTMDGGSLNNPNEAGSDDAVVLGGVGSASFENDDTVQYNTIKDTYDDGIEGAGALNGNNISYNNITSAYVTGIGSYHYTSWSNNVVSYNTVTATNQLSELFYIYEIEGFAAGIKPQFVNNSFISNTFNPAPGAYDNGISIQFDPSIYTLSNNLFKDNNLSHLSTMYQPFIKPNTMAVDGGGNVCVTNALVGYPPLAFKCN
jgi:hypothetical protein